MTEQVRSTCGCAAAMTVGQSNSCDYFGVIPKSWQDAEVACERLGTYLATVHSAEEEIIMLDYVKRERNDMVDFSRGYMDWRSRFFARM